MVTQNQWPYIKNNKWLFETVASKYFWSWLQWYLPTSFARTSANTTKALPKCGWSNVLKTTKLSVNPDKEKKKAWDILFWDHISVDLTYVSVSMPYTWSGSTLICHSFDYLPLKDKISIIHNFLWFLWTTIILLSESGSVFYN